MPSYRFPDSGISPSRHPFAVVPHDANPLPSEVRGLYIGTAGNVTLKGSDSGADVVFKNVPAGAILDVVASHVRATGTTAADIVGLA